MYRYVCLMTLVWATTIQGQDHPTATVPANMSVLEHSPTGVIYVPDELADQLEKLNKQIAELKQRQFKGGLPKAKQQELTKLNAELRALRAVIAEKQVHAEPFQLFSQRDVQSLEIAESGQIVITSDDVVLRGWNGKNIKCVIEKVVLSEEDPDKSEFDAIQVAHEIRKADDLIGLSDADRKTAEEKFLASEDGKKLTGEGRERRKKFVDRIHHSYWMYKPLQGHEVSVLRVVGLHGQEGNQHLTGATKSPGGGATLGGYWKRSARVTIYVPKCSDIAVRGCKKTVDIKSIDANLIVTTHGSQDTSYGSDFAIRDIDGDLTIYQAPIRDIDGVTGDLQIVQTDEYTNTGIHHAGGMRTASSPPPHPTKVTNVAGNFTGHFVRADLRVDSLKGALDVMNEYGNTTIIVKDPLVESSHRVVSHSGIVRAVLPEPKAMAVKVYAFTQTGTVRTAFDRRTLDDKSFGSDSRSWYGFQSADAKGGLAMFDRPQRAWDNEKRSGGLDLISIGGVVVVERAKKAE